MDTQTKYAVDQYYLCCKHLGISPKYDDPGRTLLESVVLLEKDLGTLDNEVMYHRIEGTEELARLESIARDAINLLTKIDYWNFRSEILELKKRLGV